MPFVSVGSASMRATDQRLELFGKELVYTEGTDFFDPYSFCTVLYSIIIALYLAFASCQYPK